MAPGAVPLARGPVDVIDEAIPIAHKGIFDVERAPSPLPRASKCLLTTVWMGVQVSPELRGSSGWCPKRGIVYRHVLDVFLMLSDVIASRSWYPVSPATASLTHSPSTV